MNVVRMCFMKKLSRLCFVLLFGVMVGVAIFHFINSLLTLKTTTDIVLARTKMLPKRTEGSAIPTSKYALDSPKLRSLHGEWEEAQDSWLPQTQQQLLVSEELKVSSHNSKDYDDGRQTRETEVKHASIHTGAIQPYLDELHATVGEQDYDHLAWKNMTISEQEHFQQAAVKKFCERNSLNFFKPERLGRHFLTHDQAKTLFCFAPKVGCTNLKILFFVSQGAISSNELFKGRDNVNQEHLEEAIKQLSFTGMKANLKMHIVQNYYKFLMYRNPVERLFSGYRSKVQRYPLVGLKINEPHYNWLRMRIFSYKHPSLYRKWRVRGGREQVHITFSDFIDFWLERKTLRLDEHFQSIYQLCQPCQVQYNYYGNFNTFDRDAEVLIKHLDSSSTLLRSGYHKEKDKTAVIAPEYYRSLSDRQKKRVITKLALDLSFYYTVFPSERDSHKSIMNTSHNVPVFEY